MNTRTGLDEGLPKTDPVNVYGADGAGDEHLEAAASRLERESRGVTDAN